MPRSFRENLLAVIVVLCVFAVAIPASAEDWGAYALIPVSAPRMVLEVVGSGAAEGALISIGKPAGSANQKWFIVPNANGSFAIKPSYSSTLVMAVKQGGTNNGTAIVLEPDGGKPWQQWTLVKNEGGSYTLIPKHAPDKGLDDFGGEQSPGARQDLWENHPGDPHLQWIIKPLAGILPHDASSSGEAEASTYTPPDLKPEQILHGEVKTFTFSSSTIFPGTVRSVSVFIPAQYDRSKPACVYVKTDGYNDYEKSLLETMMAGKEIPVTVGVFVAPGELPATVKNTMGRRNRCFEYDGVGDNNVRFLTEELLPYVAKKYSLNLSTSGNDRCIAGGSSGGITAFNAAWERPDAFSRVYAASGSFVAFRGGHEFPTLIRKFEAKPIRAYLTTGTNDMENAAGDWFLLDQEMDKALKFSGYDYFFRIVNGGHVAGYFDNFREAMRYLWKGWPQAVQAGPSAPRVRDVILPPGDPQGHWQQIAWSTMTMGTHDLRGPAVNAEGEVYFADTAANKICRIDLEGNVTDFLTDGGNANGLSFGPDNALYTVSSRSGKLMRYDRSVHGSMVATGIHGRYVLAMPGGGLYVAGERDRATGAGEVWFVKGSKKTLVASGLKLATGMAYRPDQWLLSVADGHSKWAYSFQINPDGTLTNKERFFWLHVPDWEDDAGAESVCYAREGQMLVATCWGIQICADDGPTQLILPLPDRSRVVGVCLGGKNMDTLYAFSGDKIWKRKVKIHGFGAFSPWKNVNGTTL